MTVSSTRNRATTTHPAQRFAAPASIQRGVPLRNLIGRESIALLAESIVAVYSRFDTDRFVAETLRGLRRLELKERGVHVARALASHLPGDFAETAEILIASFGPELSSTEGNGLAPFFYLPHSSLIAMHGPACFESGMRANYELTKRFSAEFSLRPFLIAQQAESLSTLERWTADPNPHVRRLVSEGTRPRLPWAMRLRAFQQDPRPTLALLERLKDDPEPYVQRSVANHLGDVLKDNPDAAYETCGRWVEEASGRRFDPVRARARFWIVRHAVRLPARKGDSRAVQLRERARPVA